MRPPRACTLALSLLQSYQTDIPFSGTTQINSAQIVAFDAPTKRLYVASSIGSKPDTLSLANPTVAAIDIRAYGSINWKTSATCAAPKKSCSASCASSKWSTWAKYTAPVIESTGNLSGYFYPKTDPVRPSLPT